ncbi:MAG: Maf family nucleotide pyrophosphatase [Alphaproteobacteria bacterium]
MPQCNRAPRLVLASASPRRLELLTQIGLPPNAVIPADIDETPLPRELPRQYAARIAAAKCDVVATQYPDSIVLAADTVVARGRRILPKADNLQTARDCLNLLSGERHRVYGGIALCGPDGRRSARIVLTAVVFKRLSQDEIESYLSSGEWNGKAGGYAIQGRAAAFVRQINGSYSNVVGLPLFETAQLLQGMGLRA